MGARLIDDVKLSEKKVKKAKETKAKARAEKKIKKQKELAAKRLKAHQVSIEAKKKEMIRSKRFARRRDMRYPSRTSTSLSGRSLEASSTAPRILLKSGTTSMQKESTNGK